MEYIELVLYLAVLAIVGVLVGSSILKADAEMRDDNPES